MSQPVPRVVAGTPLDATIEGLLRGRVEVVPLDSVRPEGSAPIEADGVFTFGHLAIDGALLDRIRGLKVISNDGIDVVARQGDDAGRREAAHADAGPRPRRTPSEPHS